MMIQIKVEHTLEVSVLYIDTHMNLDNGQVQPHLQVLRQCPVYGLEWVPMTPRLQLDHILLFGAFCHWRPMMEAKHGSPVHKSFVDRCA